MRRTLKVILCVVVLMPTVVQAILIKDQNLIFDTASGLYWVPSSPLSGALALEDLPPGTRYANTLEVNDLLDRYVIVHLNTGCGPGYICDPMAYQAIVHFIDIFNAFPPPIPGTHGLQAVYNADAFDSTTLTLSAIDENFVISTFDRQSNGHEVPLAGEFGMLLISAVPEPATLVLFGIGVAFLVGRRILMTPPLAQGGERSGGAREGLSKPSTQQQGTV
jgi:PEP-CTERM motif-containing protein